jgi:histidine triad (HIT) family protein
MDETCVFCKKIWGNDNSAQLVTNRPGQLRVFTFEPLNPVTPGHRLFVPQTHYERAEESPYDTGETLAQTMNWVNYNFAQDYNIIINSGPDASQTVGHFHIHYIPRLPNDGLILPWTDQKKKTTLKSDDIYPFNNAEGVKCCSCGKLFKSGDIVTQVYSVSSGKFSQDWEYAHVTCPQSKIKWKNGPADR